MHIIQNNSNYITNSHSDKFSNIIVLRHILALHILRYKPTVAVFFINGHRSKIFVLSRSFL